MNQLISAMGNSIAALYGSGSVFFGDAPEASQYPYIVYSVQASGFTEYSTCTRSAGAVRTTSFQISVWSESSIEAGNIIEAIILDIENNGVTMSSNKCLNSNTVDWAVFVDPDREQAGERVWQGVAIVEIVWTKGG